MKPDETKSYLDNANNHAVAYVESTPGLPIRSRSKDFLISHVQAALEAIRQALSKPDVATDDSICLAVVLLMLTAVSFVRLMNQEGVG